MQVSSDNNADPRMADGVGIGVETNTGRDWMIDNYFVAQSMGYSGLQSAPTAPTRERADETDS